MVPLSGKNINLLSICFPILSCLLHTYYYLYFILICTNVQIEKELLIEEIKCQNKKEKERVDNREKFNIILQNILVIRIVNYIEKRN